MPDSEKLIEKTLKREIKSMDGWAIKLLCGLIAGLPDQMCLLPNGVIFFAELKSTGKKITAIQHIVHEKLRRLGFNVYIIDNLNDLEMVLNTYRGEVKRV